MDVAAFGIIVADVIGSPIDLRSPPHAGGLSAVDSVTLTTGGNACNLSMALARLGLSAAACGMVGDDILGRAIVERLKRGGVDTSAILTTESAQTSATIVAVEPGGERTFFHAPGVTPLIAADAFRKCFDVFRQCAWVQIGYFGLLPAGLTADLPDLLDELRQTAPGTKIALDTIDPPANMKLLDPILPKLDLFAPSRREAHALSGAKSPEKMVAFFRAHMPEGLIGIKLDSDGCYLDDGADAVRALAYQVDVVDTTGAGDCWFAGLLAGIRQNLPLEQCARLANRAAADCCTAIGGADGVRTLKETMAAVT